MPEPIARSEGRALFGRDARGYDAARPDYPDRVFELLVERCGLADGCRTLEVGAGSGKATRRLVELGARPLVAVEPDRGFEPALEALARASGGAVVPHCEAFESVALDEGAFDLAVSATAFHWLDPQRAPQKLGACLRPGGWLVLFWNVFGDPREPDPFHEATVRLLAGQATSPSHPTASPLPFALDFDARRADFRKAGADEEFALEEIRWTLVLTPDRVRSLYATYSSVSRLADAERGRLLDALAATAEHEFGGRVERRMVTPVYLGRQRAAARPDAVHAG